MKTVTVHDPELQGALHRLFKGRCAFCESKVPTKPYRFRPTEEAGPSGQAPREFADRNHLYYSWLTNAWQNIYPICGGCNPVEASIFPVRGKRCPLPSQAEIKRYASEPTGVWPGPISERALFLDPCGGHPFPRHFAAGPSGELRHLSDQAEATIRHFHLDRPELINSRFTLFQAYFSELLASPDARVTKLDPFAFQELEFGGSWFLVLYELGLRLGGGPAGRRLLRRDSIGRFYRDRLKEKGFETRLTKIYGELLDHPERVRQRKQKLAPAASGEARPTKFQIRNFKAIEHLDIELRQASERLTRDTQQPMASCLLILGENAAGKSSILEAMALALADEDSRDHMSLDAAAAMLDPTLMGASDSTPPPERAEVSVHYEDHDDLTLEITPTGMREQPNAQRTCEQLLSRRIPVFAYGAFRLFTREPGQPSSVTAIRSLFEPNFVLPNPEKWLFSIEGKPLFDEVIRALRSILAIGETFEKVEVDRERKRCLLVTKSVDGNGKAIVEKTPLSVVSSGFRSVLGMACDVMRRLTAQQTLLSASLAKARAVVLIDEIEAHLHPRWKLQIMQGLREALPNVTFIATTHDPLCVRGMADAEIMVLRRVARPKSTKKNPIPVIVESVPNLPAVGALGIEQLLTSDLFQLFTTDDPEVETSFAGVADLLAAERANRLQEGDGEKLREVRARIKRDISLSLPVGSTEVQRVVQEAVEDYIRNRPHTSAERLAALRSDTKTEIINALGRT